MEISALHKLFLQTKSVSTDSRKIGSNSIYFALSGERFNGNDFAIDALNNGALYAVVDAIKYKDHPGCIYVADALKTLQALGTYHRNFCKAKVISLTGSNGKTTTKELIYKVLSQKYNTSATLGNLNNHIGVPLSLLNIKEGTEFAVIEMGANHQKEIEFLCALAQPDFGCITNFGKAHLEGFGGVQGVIKGKSELYQYLIANNKTILYNNEDPIQAGALRQYDHSISFGKDQESTYTTSILESNTSVKIQFQDTTINTSLYGAYNATNCMIAASIGRHFDVPIQDIKNAIESYKPNNNRSELRQIGPHMLVLDAYNANPSSMEVAIKHFSELSHSSLKNKIVVLGDMFELGETAAKEHQAIVAQLKLSKINRIILIGALFHNTQHSFESYPNFDAFKQKNSPFKSNPSLVLIKGSRGMALERVLPLLE